MRTTHSTTTPAPAGVPPQQKTLGVDYRVTCLLVGLTWNAAWHPVDVAARAQILEPDITLTWRIVAALTEDAPAENGWAAYSAVAATYWNRLDDEFGKLAPPQLEAARVLARDRLITLASALPSSQRPLPLPQAASLKVLRQRYTQLKELLQDMVPQMDRLLFTLPGAY